jgi:hypothetical protein
VAIIPTTRNALEMQFAFMLPSTPTALLVILEHFFGQACQRDGSIKTDLPPALLDA